MATASASASVTAAATWPLMRSAARAMKKKMMGMAAASDDSHRLPSGV